MTEIYSKIIGENNMENFIPELTHSGIQRLLLPWSLGPQLLLELETDLGDIHVVAL